VVAGNKIYLNAKSQHLSLSAVNAPKPKIGVTSFQKISGFIK
jgi:hypothetical protein